MIVELKMFWSDMKEGKWVKTSLISSASIGRPRSCMPSVHGQDYNMDAVMKLHSCWHSLNLIFDAVHQQCLEKRKRRWAKLVKSYFPSHFVRAKRTVHFHSWCYPVNWKDNRLRRIQCLFWQGKRIQISLHCNWAQVGLLGMLKKYQ